MPAATPANGAGIGSTTHGTLVRTNDTSAVTNLADAPATRRGELDFWHHLDGDVVQAHTSAATAGQEARQRCLDRMRSLLDGRENRDVLYSIAVLREYAPTCDAALDGQSQARQAPYEGDARGKLAIATRYIRDQSALMGGTTNVARRLCDVAYQAYIRPGYNIDTASRRLSSPPA